MHDPLYGGATHRARLAELAVHAHVGVEGRHLFWEAISGFFDASRRPAVEDLDRGRMQACDLPVVQIGVHLGRGELGTPQDLVGEGASDTGEPPGVGERPFQRMPLGEQALFERIAVQIRDLGAPGIECGQRFLSPNEVHRRSPLGSSLGEQQRPVVEIYGS